MLAATGGGYDGRGWATVAAGLGVEASVESGGVVFSGGNGGRLLPLWSEVSFCILCIIIFVRLL